jgi:4-hydroxyphenylpyruvate dioxygenase
MATHTKLAPIMPPRPDHDPMPLHGIHHLELYVGNAKQAAHYWCTAFGFRPGAYAGLETGVRDRASYLVRQGRIRLVLTGALHSDSSIAAHQHRHGDGVKVIALSVPDATAAFEHALAHGADAVFAPERRSDEHGDVTVSAIRTYGETVHEFVEHHDYRGPFLPGYEAIGEARRGAFNGASAEARLGAGNGASGDDMLLTIDHVVGNVELGKMNEWVAFYERVFGMTEMIHFTDRDISTEYSALMSKVMTDGRGLVKFPINEPAEGRRKSQIDEYLEFYEGPGVQHIALATRDIVGTVTELRRRGVEFLTVPESYYDEVPGRVPEVNAQLEDLRRLGILVDRDDEGYLLQLFTKPVGDRPTMFIEVIERHGARGFGDGNFKALFEAIEREQARRGNL